MNILQRFTTEYVELEDRIRLTGELVTGDTVVLWLTQRLMNRLVPHLAAWLARQLAPASGIPSVQAAHQEVVQGFAQQAAQAKLAPEAPVQASSPGAVWRADSVDIAEREGAVVLTFKGNAGGQATLLLAGQLLRQWLGIVFEQYLRGEWPTTIWPGWMEAARPQAIAGARVLH
jgi:hypothetical protein